MKYYPINLNISNEPCLVVGGGRVGTRKVETLLHCGACVTVVSLVFSQKLQDLAGQRRVSLIERAYCPSDLDNMFLVICATDNEQLNRQVSTEAHARRMLCNVADFPEICNFILPAIVEQGDLVIAVSTSGKSPALAKKLKHDLAGQFGPEYDIFLRLMGEIRKKLLSREHAPEAHKPLFETLINRGLLSMIKAADAEGVRLLLEEVLGETVHVDEMIARILV